MIRAAALLVVLAGCARDENIPGTPVVVAQGSSLKPHVGKRVQVRGYLLRSTYKGFPHLYQSGAKEEEPFFLVSFPEKLDWRSRLHRELLVVGIVKEEPGFTEEEKQPGKIPQGYPEGAFFVSAESITDALK